MTPYIYQDQYNYNIKFHFPRFSKFETQNRSVTITTLDVTLTLIIATLITDSPGHF